MSVIRRSDDAVPSPRLEIGSCDFGLLSAYLNATILFQLTVNAPPTSRPCRRFEPTTVAQMNLSKYVTKTVPWIVAVGRLWANWSKTPISNMERVVGLRNMNTGIPYKLAVVKILW